MDISIVVPVFNSSQTLAVLVERLMGTMEKLGMSYELLFVDDGSQDDSWQTLCQLHRDHPDRVVAIQLMRNFGQHNALMCGFRHSQGRCVVTLDDDMQNPPEEIPRLIQAIGDRNLDLVYGVPEQKRHSSWRNVGSWVVRTVFRIMFRTRISIGSFRIMRRELVESIFSYTLNFTFVDGLLAWNTQRIGQVTVNHQPRKTGRTGYSLSKLVVLALNLFTNFSLLPLQVVSFVGFIAATAGLVTGMFYLVASLLHGISVPGYASIIVSILVLGGIQLLSLGMIGEYVGRLHLNVNRKPQYTIRKAIHASRVQPANAGDSPAEAGRGFGDGIDPGPSHSEQSPGVDEFVDR